MSAVVVRRSLAAALVDALVRPRRFVMHLESARARRVWIVAVVFFTLPYSGLLLALAIDGHAPSGPLFLPVSRAHYYAFEALFVAPLYLFSSAAAAWVSARLLHGLPQQRRDQGALAVDARVWRALVGSGLSTSTLIALVGPDTVLLALFGFEMLGVAIRVLAPAAALLMWVRVALSARAFTGASTTRAFAVGFAAVAVHLALTAPFLR